MSGIVVGVDGSYHSQKALDWALNESALRHAPLTVLTVSPVAASIWGLSGQAYPQDETTREQVKQATQEFVQKALSQRHDDPPVKVTVRVLSGLPADELIKASADADLMVLASRGAGGFSRLTLGSVSTQVLHHALCPVIVVPHDDRR